jgi:photosystem II stability/assembly factor-like uncharacterized protein
MCTYWASRFLVWAAVAILYLPVKTASWGWDTIASPVTTANLLDVKLVNKTHGFAVGNEDTILRTVDGGQTWIAGEIATSVWLAYMLWSTAHPLD